MEPPALAQDGGDHIWTPVDMVLRSPHPVLRHCVGVKNVFAADPTAGRPLTASEGRRRPLGVEEASALGPLTRPARGVQFGGAREVVVGGAPLQIRAPVHGPGPGHEVQGHLELAAGMVTDEATGDFEGGAARLAVALVVMVSKVEVGWPLLGLTATTATA